jgi:hypothetical protein
VAASSADRSSILNCGEIVGFDKSAISHMFVVLQPLPAMIADTGAADCRSKPS